ncbi:sensor histidine kinase [Flavobacterium akiainvivens]|uniref:sensor histidine kinase n=1 Tax=Flavobacterium akiainvivens TaxID=1202724 RepID=UPI0006C84EBB|nr:sensor histidine kinase [Flavobacterium akiainvivens]SFQ09285.1 Histidine kinase [Flavobacterium akiainvivens]
MAKKTQYYLLALLGSLLYISVPVLVSPDTHGKTSLLRIDPFKREFLSHILLLGFFYFNFFYLVPQFYFTRRFKIFFGLVVVCLLATLLIPNLFFHEGMPGGMPGPNMNMPMPKGAGMPPRMWRRQTFIPPMYIGGTLHFLLIFFLSFLLRLSRRLEVIQQEKLKTEVSYLKAQINPHFLFNTLNSLYALTLEKNDAAPEAVLKLSSMMRYVVTESGRESVSLESEINYLKNYVSLQQLRMDDTTMFAFIVDGNLVGKYISPMLLIPFVENAFKYGLNPEEEADIAINIFVDEKTLQLSVCNKKVAVALQPDEESGHGLENTRQRLDYLYANRYELKLNDEKGYFNVNLKIILS